MTTVTQLADRYAGFTARRATITPPAPTCPTHRGVVLDEGPVQYRCPRGHQVQAADIDHEHHAPLGGAA